MKNFNNFYKKVDALAGAKKASDKTVSAKGLAARSSPSMKQETSSKDIYNQVAEYITAIRKQKQELMNGKS